MDTEADLPRSNVRRIVKQKITELKGTGGADIHLNRDALTALGEACRVFIHLLSATANEICTDAKRQTISVDDVLGALEDLEFSDLISELEGDIENHRTEMRERAKKRSESIKKRKAQKAAEELAMETTAAAGETAAPAPNAASADPEQGTDTNAAASAPAAAEGGKAPKEGAEKDGAGGGPEPMAE